MNKLSIELNIFVILFETWVAVGVDWTKINCLNNEWCALKKTSVVFQSCYFAMNGSKTSQKWWVSEEKMVKAQM